MRRFKFIDKSHMIVVLLLGIIGIVLIRSTSLGTATSSIYWKKQCFWIVAGTVIYLVMSAYDYKKLISKANIFYIIGLVSLVAVLYTRPINGATSWFRLPFMSIQPSEVVKIATILMVVRFYKKADERRTSLRDFLLSAVLIGMPVALIAKQSDLGTAFLYLPFFVIPNFLIGNKESIYVTVGGLVVVVLLVLGLVHKPDWFFFVKPYQRARIVSYIYPDKDTANRGWQVHQSKISIGQGGLLGQGLGKGKQTKMGFLPAQQTDFILAVAGEELGFVGMSTIFGLFIFLFWRSFQIALESRDMGGSMLVVLVIGTLLVQLLFNAGMMIGLVPTTGIPCPLISYGGSSMMTTMALLGLIQSVHNDRYVNT